ncbi:MAG: YciI family protein [Flavobacteriaceae bacterium]
MTQLKEFVLLFRYEPDNEEPTQEQLQEMHKHWEEFIGGIAMQGKLVSTHQLGFEGKKIFANQNTEDGLHIAEGHTVGGNMVLKAESIESATELAKKCPILFMGGMVEVRNVLPMN